MKPIVPLLFLLSIAVQAIGQNVFIPDPNFRLFLQTDYGSCMNGDSLDTTCVDLQAPLLLNISGIDAENLFGIQYFENLLHLHCHVDGSIIEIPELPPNLETLLCNDNQLESLPALPSTLRTLWCYNNNLTELPELPSSLETLDCKQLAITELPELPASLVLLDCGYTLIDSLPNLPPSLEMLYCHNLGLPTLPTLPNGLQGLFAANNSIGVLPALPDSLQALHVQNNLLKCLPAMPENLVNVYLEGNDIECIPNLPSDPYVDITLPTCPFNDTHLCSDQPVIFGRSVYDQNSNCSDDGELGLQHRVVFSELGYYAITDSFGYYELYVDAGNHSVNQESNIGLWDIDCPIIPYSVSVSEVVDSIYGIDMYNNAPENCHWLWIDVAANNQRPCFSTNSFHVQYCNLGTEAVSNAHAVVALPDELWLIDATIPWQHLGDGFYLFELGDLDIDQCGTFAIIDSVDCEAEIGAAVCIKAVALPPSLCNFGGPLWDYSSVQVSASCVADTSVEFVIKNIGEQNMILPSQYRVFQNNGLYIADQAFQLLTGDSIIVSVAATGDTYRLEADQVNDHPGNSNPRATVEGCGNPAVLGQVTSVFFDDLDDFIDIECEVLSAAYDPNDKQVIPSGVGPAHIVHPENEILEYKIRFQNTGMDTAFNIEVVDTLPAAFVSVETFKSGASSDPYTVTMHGNGIVSWRFYDILLPDSNINEPESHGFVKFKIHQKPNLPNGTVINNSAAIYFDYNAPIITNTSFITISDTVMWAEGVGIEEKIQFNVSVQPNPFNEMCLVQLDESIANGQFQVFDPMGRLVHADSFTGNQFQLSAAALENGIYTIRLLDKGTVRGNTRVSVLR